ncbi:MAG: PhoH family protein [Thermodesulfovibrionales bacterium]
MQKHFILDTNVLLHSADALHSFADNFVVLPMTVIEELDRFKSHNDELGRNARRVIRDLDRLRTRGSLGSGVGMENGGVLLIEPEKNLSTTIGIDLSVPDNRILAVAYNLHSAGKRVIFVSKDINARLKADALGLEVMDFEKQKVNFEDLYTGHRDVRVPGTLIDELGANGQITLDAGFVKNEFALLIDAGQEKHTMLGRARDERTLVKLQGRSEGAWTIHARSAEQRMAFELLMDPAVELVTLVGQAGTGKTLLALAAALECTLKQEKYEKVLVSRPVIPLGRDIGYLPGTKDEKLALWMQPIFDNLTYLMREGRKREAEGSVQMKIDKLMRNHFIELEALTYIRGRSIPGQFIIVDEAQNLTPHEVKTIISRAGEGTKMVLTGDPYQIDNPYLDASSNGLTYTVERLKGLAVHGHVTLTRSERSGLSAIAADHL